MSSAASALAAKDRFAERHLGPRDSDHAAMLQTVGVDSLDDIVRKTVPSQILLDRALDLGKYSPVPPRPNPLGCALCSTRLSAVSALLGRASPNPMPWTSCFRGVVHENSHHAPH